MTRQEPQQALLTGEIYAEDRSAIRWPYAVHLVLWALILAIGFVGMAVAANPGWGLPVAVGTIGLFTIIALTVMAWPVGIRIDDDGIRIGGVRRTRRPGRRLPWAGQQRREILLASWSAISAAAVITDKAGIREAGDLRKGDVVRLGVLWAPFARAALVIEIDPARVALPRFREQDITRPFWRPARLAPVRLSPVWYVPTRHPGALRAALAQHAGSFGGRPDPRLPAYLRLLFERAGVVRS